MLKLLSQTCLSSSLESLVNVSQQTRSIRIRKPPWVPRSKAKAFRVPPLKEENRHERDYIMPIWNEYKAHMRSIYQLFKTEAKFTDRESFKAQEEKKKLAEREMILLLENEKHNREILEIQLGEEHAKLEAKKRQIEIEFKKKLKLDELHYQQAEQQVKKLKEKAKNFIDPNNLEYEIERALNERFDYNFAIDSSGRLFKNKVLVSHLQAFDGKFIPVPKRAQLIESQSSNVAAESSQEQSSPKNDATA